jgi:hypothetical protein
MPIIRWRMNHLEDPELLETPKRVSASIPETFAGKIGTEQVSLPNTIGAQIRNFLFTNDRCVKLKPDAIQPAIISRRNLVTVCEKMIASPGITAFDEDGYEYDLSATSYPAVSVAKAYLQSVGRYIRLTREQFIFIRDNFLSRGVFTRHPAGSMSYEDDKATVYGVISYLINDRNWMDTYLQAPEAVFADVPDIHWCVSTGLTWHVGDQEQTSIINAMDMIMDGVDEPW